MPSTCLRMAKALELVRASQHYFVAGRDSFLEDCKQNHENFWLENSPNKLRLFNSQTACGWSRVGLLPRLQPTVRSKLWVYSSKLKEFDFEKLPKFLVCCWEFEKFGSLKKNGKARSSPEASVLIQLCFDLIFARLKTQFKRLKNVNKFVWLPNATIFGIARETSSLRLPFQYFHFGWLPFQHYHSVYRESLWDHRLVGDLPFVGWSKSETVSGRRE